MRDHAREAATAKYQVGGFRVPSVSEILKLAGLDSVAKLTHVDPEIIAKAADRGREVHNWIELIDDGSANWDEVKDSIRAPVRTRVEGWLRFRDDAKPVTQCNERAWVSDDLGFAGTIDWVGKLYGDDALIDWKGGTKYPEAALQTAGYNELLPTPHERYALYLPGNGKYKLVKYESPLDRETFLGALLVAKWKLRNGAALENG